MLKFRGGDISIQTDKPGLGRRGVSFLISLLFHAVLIFLVVHTKYTYKIYPEEVTEVIIIPPDKIFIPENMKIYTKSSPELGFENKREFSGEKWKSEEELETKAQETPHLISRKNLTINQSLSKNVYESTDDLTNKSDLTSAFKLELPQKSKTILPENYKLDLSPNFEEKILGEIEKGYVSKELDLSKYGYFDTQGPPLTKTMPSGRFRKGGLHPQGRASFQTKGYDLSPWAEKVVDRIQKNWIISADQEIKEKAVVEISVTIEKNGQLSSNEIVNSSLEPLLDQAALKALKLSSPFPKLPDDFPYKNLEASFVFEYHD